jgi:hypothetical protein
MCELWKDVSAVITDQGVRLTDTVAHKVLCNKRISPMKALSVLTISSFFAI